MAEVAHVDACSRIFRVRLVRTRPVLVVKSRKDKLRRKRRDGAGGADNDNWCEFQFRNRNLTASTKYEGALCRANIRIQVNATAVLLVRQDSAGGADNDDNDDDASFGSGTP